MRQVDVGGALVPARAGDLLGPPAGNGRHEREGPARRHGGVRSARSRRRSPSAAAADDRGRLDRPGGWAASRATSRSRADTESRSSPPSSTSPSARCGGATANAPTASRRRRSPPSCAASARRWLTSPLRASTQSSRQRRTTSSSSHPSSSTHQPLPTDNRRIRCRSRSDCSCRDSRGRAGAPSMAHQLAAIAGEAEEAGFSSIWVMDHYLQIPQVGREWEEMLEAYTTLGYLAGRTTTARLGTLCTGITYRNIAALGKIVATLDVLSGGRAMAGLGIGWFEREHHLYGWEFPPRSASLRAARGRPAAAPAALGQGIAAVRGPNGHRARGDLLPASAAGAHPDPRRRLRRAPHAAPRRPLRRRLQPVRRRRDRASQGRRPPSALRRPRPRPGRGDRDEPDVSPRDRRRRRATRRRTPARWTSRSVATAPTPRPACRPPSCRSPTSPRAASSASPPCSPLSAA